MALPNTHSAPHLLPTSLRALIMSSGFWALSLALTGTAGSAAAVLGCLLGCVMADTWVPQPPLNRLRTGWLLLGSLGLAGCGVIASAGISGSAGIAQWLSPIGGYALAESVRWLLVAAAITVALRSLALRTELGVFLEILFVASAFVITLAAHRNGMIHRPYFIGDFALMRGIDPASILMAIGCGAVLGLSALLMMESNQRRLPYHFAILGLLCFTLLAYVQVFGLPTPSYTDSLGLTGTGASQTPDDNPFKNGENNADNLQAPVAVVLFRDDYEPPGGSYYFRETAYSQWNGQLLVETDRQDMDRDLVDGFSTAGISVAEPPPSRDARRLVRTSIGTLTPHRAPFGLDTPVAFGDLPNPNSLRFKRTFEVESWVPEFTYDNLIGQETGAEHWSADVWREYLRHPDDARYGELAESLLATLRPEYRDDPFARAFAIKSYLDENGIYSLRNVHALEPDPAGSFLFGDLTGYCMHFAFAATYLYRSLGLPARVGIGYSVPAANRAGGSALLVQAIHGHAWPEVYFRDYGWVIIDPTPQQTLVDMTTDPQNGLQQMLGDMLRDDAAYEQFLVSQSGGGIPLGMLLNMLYAALAAALGLGYTITFARWWRGRHAGAALGYRLTYRAALDRLAAAGIRRSVGESREAFAARVAALVPSFAALTRAHLRMALGAPVTTTATHSTDWAKSLIHLETELKRGLPWWKRVLAILNPCPWLLAR